MLNPLVFSLSKAANPVLTLLGNPPRVFEFGEAEQNAPAPYATWQTVGGSPENILNGAPPTADRWSVQIDCYATTSPVARALAQAMRDALQVAAYVTSWNGEFIDTATRLRRASFTVEFMQDR